MKRREFITLLGGAAAVWPLTARAQQAERVRKVGVLAPAAAGTPLWQGYLAAFREELQKLGWSPRNVAIAERWGVNAEQVRSHAAELVAMAPDVILGGAATGSRAAASDQDDTDRVRVRSRSGSPRSCHQPGAAGRQYHRVREL